MNTLSNSSIGNSFDNVFAEIDNAKKLNLKNNNCLRLFYLDILKNEFNITCIGHFILGYAQTEPAPASPRKENYVYFVE